MKKNLLTLALAAGVLLPVSAQWTQVGGTVKVMPETLKYVSQDYDVNGTSSVSNEGNVKVDGAFSNTGATTGANDGVNNFVNEFNTGLQYGQLILNQTTQSVGKIISEFGNASGTEYYNQHTGMPFNDVYAEQLIAMTEPDATTINWQWQPKHAQDGVFVKSRYKNPLFTNRMHAGIAGAEERIPGELLEVGLDHIINQGYYNLPARVSSYEGTAANTAHSFIANEYYIETNQDVNVFGEWAYTYINDFTEPLPAGWGTYVKDAPVLADNGFGDNIFYFGNPYTSNIDLEPSIPLDGSVLAVGQVVGNNFDPTSSNGQVLFGDIKTNLSATFVPSLTGGDGSFTGDVSAFVVRPFNVYQLKTAGTVSFDLNDANKTFLDYKVNDLGVEEEAPTYFAKKSKKGDKDELNEMRVDISLPGGKSFGNVYVVAHPSFEASAKGQGTEAYNLVLGDNQPGIYTFQETEDGNIDESLKHNKTYINGINSEKYVGMPITMAHQVTKSGSYDLTFYISEQLENSSDKFYFEDKLTGVVKEVTPKMVYSFDTTESTFNRFNFFWNGLPETYTLGIEDIVEAPETLVYKDGSEFKVRFAKDLNRADIYVYNALGQLVINKKAVNTANDYTLKLSDAKSAYIVKVVGDNGKVTTKKIIK